MASRYAPLLVSHHSAFIPHPRIADQVYRLSQTLAIEYLRAGGFDYPLWEVYATRLTRHSEYVAPLGSTGCITRLPLLLSVVLLGKPGHQ
jgi:hypothetical protein